MPRIARWREPCDDHIRPEHPDHAYHIAQHFLLPPLLETLLRALAVAEVHRTGEELLTAIDAPCFEQLLRADDAQRVAQFGADQVLSTIAACEAEVAGADLPAIAQPGDQTRVLIIGMRRDVKHTAQHIELLHLVQDLGGVGLRGWSLGPSGQRRVGNGKCDHGRDDRVTEE